MEGPVEATSRRAFLALGVGAVVVTGAVRCAQPEPGLPLGPVDPASIPTVPAHPADSLCESYAVNTKLFYASQVYAHTDAVIDLLHELGVRTIRERVTTGTSPGALAQRYAMPRLAELGIRWHATVGELDDWSRAEVATREAFALFLDFYAPAVDGSLASLVHSFGGCNEVDGSVVDGAVDPQWAAHARLMQAELWRQATSSPLTDSIPVAGPSTRSDVTAARAAALGDLSAVSDWGNAHLYNRGSSPTRGIDEHLAVLERCFPDANRWIFTETGYNNAPQDDSGRTVSEDAAATYAIRGICDFFRRDSIYGRFELLDDPDPIDFTTQNSINTTAERQAHFGLVAMTEESVTAATPDTWRRKPEFFATQRFLRLMSDKGPSFRTDPLNLLVTGGGADLQQALVQKRDGRHYLLLWRDVEVATSFPEARPLQVAPATLTVHLRSARPAAVYSPRFSSAPVATHPRRDTVTLEVGGDLMVVEIG
ncbi:MAG: hypothetical protein ACR2LE_02655 [Nocardioidaceae bacterium]